MCFVPFVWVAALLLAAMTMLPASLQEVVGSEALCSPLGRLLLGPEQDNDDSGDGGTAAAAASPLDFNAAVVLAASCQLAADSCGMRSGSSSLPHLPWRFYFIGTRDSFTHHLQTLRSVC